MGKDKDMDQDKDNSQDQETIPLTYCCRDFNSLDIYKDTITKHGELKTLRGEIFWYSNIPRQISDLFPNFYSFTDDSYCLERIDGDLMTDLYINQRLTPNMFTKFLENLHRIHAVDLATVNSIKDYQEVDIYGNYIDKITKRYTEYDYTPFSNSDKLYTDLLLWFSNYRTGKKTIIHGDPVFSNCIVREGKFYFIDMRGIVKDTLTLLGDVWYDYGKVYQSLVGYDEILFDKKVSEQYRQKIIKVFWDFIKTQYSESDFKTVKMVTKSLLFTLLPLHNNEKCHHYYQLINSV